MLTFIIGIILLLVGGAIYGNFVEKILQPDDRKTPAVELADGVDYVEMPKWKNMLIELLNIAGTGPVLGPIQGILFGPLAFITIPIGCVIAGATHDFCNGFISMRNKGAQMPRLIQKYLGKGTHSVYFIIMMVLMVLTGVVFIYTPGDLIVGELLRKDVGAGNSAIWIVYAIIFAYYLVATLFPIDQIIGRIYPIFAGILIISAVGVFGGILLDGGKSLTNLSALTMPSMWHWNKQSFIPVFFITVACGILSGFHGSQSTLISRTVRSEREGKATFYWMMIAEGFIAMCWAGGAMILYSRQNDLLTTVNATQMVGIISRTFLGNVGGILAILGTIVLPITSGDTAFRSVRLMLAERLNISQSDPKKRIGLTLVIFIPAIAILAFSKLNAGGFSLLWRYFGFTNQLVAVFALMMSTCYLLVHKKNFWITLIPGMFYTFIVTSFICHAPIGFGLESRLGLGADSYLISYIVGAVVTVLVAWSTVTYAKKHMSEIEQRVFNA